MVSRQHAVPLVDAVALPVPPGRVPLRRPRRGEPAQGCRRPRVRAARHRHLRRRPVLGDHGRLRQGRTRRPVHPRHRPQRCTRRADHRAAPHAVVPQHVVVGPGRPPTVTQRRRRCPRGRAPLTRPFRPGRGWRPWPADVRQRDQPGPALRGGERDPLPQGRDRRSRRARRRHRQPRRHRHQGGVALPHHRAGRRVGRGPPAPVGGGPRLGRRLGPDDARSRRRKPTSSTLRLPRPTPRATRRRSCARRSPGCCGPSSSTTTTSIAG